MHFLIFGQNQDKVYREVLIAGDISIEDVIYTIFPSEVPTDHSYSEVPDTAEFVYGNDTVYFAQPSQSQFAPGGSGAATYQPHPPVDLADAQRSTPVPIGNNTSDEERHRQGFTVHTARSLEVWLDILISAFFRYPQWGVRIHCEKLPDPEINMR